MSCCRQVVHLEAELADLKLQNEWLEGALADLQQQQGDQGRRQGQERQAAAMQEQQRTMQVGLNVSVFSLPWGGGLPCALVRVPLDRKFTHSQ